MIPIFMLVYVLISLFKIHKNIDDSGKIFNCLGFILLEVKNLWFRSTSVNWDTLAYSMDVMEVHKSLSLFQFS